MSGDGRTKMEGQIDLWAYSWMDTLIEGHIHGKTKMEGHTNRGTYIMLLHTDGRT